MAIRWNPREYIDELVSVGYSPGRALAMAKEESARRRKRVITQLKVDNDYVMNKGSNCVRI